MAAPQAALASLGSWKGLSRLHLPWLPEEERITTSESTLEVQVDGQKAFATVTYRWFYDEAWQESVLILCQSSKSQALEMGWVDAWHQNGAVLHLKGEASEDGLILKGKGIYSGGEEEWGWTIGLESREGALILTMDNVAPTGEAEWAVEAIYHRA